MADFAGQEVDLFEVVEGWTAAQLIAANGIATAVEIRSEFAPGWFLTALNADVAEGKVPIDG